MKFFVVPDSSERWTGVMAVAGSVASGFSAAISGASHEVILLSKIPAMVAAERLSSVTPSRLKTTAMGLM